MSEDQVLGDPTNRVVAVFDKDDKAEATRREFIDHGFSDQQIRVLHGRDTAKQVDTRAKWFADTDDEIARYRRELLAGNTVISVPVEHREQREFIHDVLRRNDARLITHFGEWLTETMQ